MFGVDEPLARHEAEELLHKAFGEEPRLALYALPEFGRNSFISRGDFVDALARIIGYKASYEEPEQRFQDVPPESRLAGPVDFHLGASRSVPAADVHPQAPNPVVVGTRCHNLAPYVAYENPMQMVADTPDSYPAQTGLEVLREVPPTWDDTRLDSGEPAELTAPARLRIAAAAYPIDRLASLDAVADKLAGWVARAVAAGAELVVFPEYGAMEIAGTWPDAVAGDLAQSLAVVADAAPQRTRSHGFRVPDPLKNVEDIPRDVVGKFPFIVTLNTPVRLSPATRKYPFYCLISQVEGLTMDSYFKNNM